MSIISIRYDTAFNPHTKGFSDNLRDVQNDNKRHILEQHLCADSVLVIPAGKIRVDQGGILQGLDGTTIKTLITSPTK